MSFPKLKSSFNTCSFGSCQREVSHEDPSTGVVQTVLEDCNVRLPDSDLFEVQNMVKAGVTLNEVNTNILGSGLDTQNVVGALNAVVDDVKKQAKKSKQTNKEVNDEN